MSHDPPVVQREQNDEDQHNEHVSTGNNVGAASSIQSGSKDSDAASVVAHDNERGDCSESHIHSRWPTGCPLLTFSPAVSLDPSLSQTQMKQSNLDVKEDGPAVSGDQSGTSMNSVN